MTTTTITPENTPVTVRFQYEGHVEHGTFARWLRKDLVVVTIPRTGERYPLAVSEIEDQNGPFPKYDGAILCKGGRTGRKVHMANPGSSVTSCGHWMKHLAVHFKVDDDSLANRQAHKPHLCERCFGKQS